jgi:hypothetical protein
LEFGLIVRALKTDYLNKRNHFIGGKAEETIPLSMPIDAFAA